MNSAIRTIGPKATILVVGALLILAPGCGQEDDSGEHDQKEEQQNQDEDSPGPPEPSTQMVWFSMQLEGAAYEPNHPHDTDRGRTVEVVVGATWARDTNTYEFNHLFTTDRVLWRGNMGLFDDPQIAIDDDGLSGDFRLWYDRRVLPIELDVERQGEELEGTYTARPADGSSASPDRDDSTIDDITNPVEGVVSPPESIRDANAFDSSLNWPNIVGTEQSLHNSDEFSLIEDAEELQIHWRSETIWGPRFRYCRDGWTWLNNTPSGGSASVIGADGILYVTHRRPRAEELGGPGNTIPCFFDSLEGEEQTLMEERFFDDLDFAESAVGSVIGVEADEVVTAIDAVTGQTLWETSFEAAGINFFDPRESPTNMTGAVDEKHLYTRDTLGVLRAFDRWDGELLWEQQIPYRYQPQYGPVTDPYQLEDFYQRVLSGGHFGFDEGRMGHGLATAEFFVVAPLHDGNTGLVAYEGPYGLTLWKIHEEIMNRRMTPLTWHYEAENPLDSQDYLITIDADGVIHLVDAIIGRVVWEYDTEWSDHGQPILVDDLLITHSGAYEISRDGADKQWDARGCVGPNRIAATIVGDNAYLRCNLFEDNGSWDADTCRNEDCHLEVRDLHSGDKLDQVPDPARSKWAHSFGLGDYLVLEERSDDDVLRWEFYDTRQLEEEPILSMTQPFHFEGSSRAHLVHPIHEGRVFVRGSDGLYALDLREN